METVMLAQESKDMEDRLQQLRESMSREKEEREWVTERVTDSCEKERQREREMENLLEV